MEYSDKTIQLLHIGRQDCRDLHAWGPGIRPCYIIHHVLRGEGYLRVRDKIYPVKAGQSFLTYPYVEMEYYPEEKDPWEYVWADFVGDMAKQMLERSIFSTKGPVCTCGGGGRIPDLFEKLLGLDILWKNRQEAGGILLSLLGIYQDAYEGEDSPLHRQKDPRLEAAFALVQANYHDPAFRVETLCGKLHVSRVTLYRMFQSEFGIAPSLYLTQYRMKQAQIMLQMGASVKTTSLSCGFADPLYFSRTFKTHVGIAPSEYAVQLRGSRAAEHRGAWV